MFTVFWHCNPTSLCTAAQFAFRFWHWKADWSKEAASYLWFNEGSTRLSVKRSQYLSKYRTPFITAFYSWSCYVSKNKIICQPLMSCRLCLIAWRLNTEKRTADMNWILSFCLRCSSVNTWDFFGTILSLAVHVLHDNDHQSAFFTNVFSAS